jgi:hypothetical protein
VRCIRPKLGSFDRSTLKSEARRFLEKSAHPPCCESPLKLLYSAISYRGWLFGCKMPTQTCQRTFIYYVPLFSTKRMGNSVQPLKTPTQVPPILLRKRISFPRWQFVSDLPIAVRGGAESLNGFHRIGDGRICQKSPRLSL